MRLQINLFLGYCIMFFNQYCLTKALIGVNVKIAAEGEYCFVACITRRCNGTIELSQNLICTGTLISSNLVLAAEHCVKHSSINSIQAVIGSVNLFEGLIYYPIEIITFDQWALRKRKRIQFIENDISLIKLTEKVPHQCTPAHVSYKSDEYLYEKNVIAVGWGILNDNTFPTHLQEVALKTLTKSECEDRVTIIARNFFSIDRRILCSLATPFSLIQFGDTGGPLLYQGKVVAINKGIIPHPEVYDPRKVNIHINVYYYKEFISYVKKH